MPNSSYGLQMLHLLREHLIGARFSLTVFGTTVTNTQSSLLNELVCRDTPSLEELCDVLKVDPSTISRTALQLRRLGMISSKRSGSDQRRVLHTCTRRGRAFIEFTWQQRREIIERRLQGFSSNDRTQLETFLRTFVGDEAFNKIVPTKNEMLLAAIFRGLTYDHGVVSGDYLESGFPSSEWMMLSEICYNGRNPGDLSKLLSAGKATISLRLRSLERRGLLVSRKDRRDKRGRILSLTARGKAALKAIEHLAEQRFNRSLARNSNPEELQRGLALFRRYVFSLKRTQILTARVVPVSDQELPELRRAALSTISVQSSRYPSAGYLLHPGNIILRVLATDAPPIIMECTRQVRDQLTLVNLFTSSIPFSSAELQHIIDLTLGERLVIEDVWERYIDSFTAPPTTSGGSELQASRHTRTRL